MNYDWWQEFSVAGVRPRRPRSRRRSSASPPRSTTSAACSTRQGEIVPIAAALAIYLLGLDRSCRAASSIATRASGRTRAHGFFAAAGVFFWRFLRLGVIAGARLLVPVRLSSTTGCSTIWYVRADARRGCRAHGVLLARRHVRGVRRRCWCAANVLFDYAKVRLVVEDRRSAVGALMAALAFIARNPGAGSALYALNALRFRAAACACGRSSLPAPEAPGCRCGWRLRARQVYVAGAAGHEAAVHGVADGAVPASARPRGVYRRAGAGVAGVTGRRSSHTGCDPAETVETNPV